MLDIVRQVIKVILWGLILQPGLALSEFLITEAQDKSYFTVEADSTEEAVESALTFCKNQDFKFDNAMYGIIRKESWFEDPIIKSQCIYDEPKELTQIQLKQLQYRKTSVPPEKMSEAVAAWATLKNPAISHNAKKSDFILPKGSNMRKDESTNEYYWGEFFIFSYKVVTSFPVDFLKTRHFFVHVDVIPSPPKLNSEGLWLALPAVKNGKVGETTIIMKIIADDKLIIKPELYNRFFKEIATSNFIQSIEYEPVPLE
jgi:hypothetical protein